MLSYQHAFHAGNRADVLKHAVLDLLLRTREAGRTLYIETHSGRGRYDLTAPIARKTAEADAGITALRAAADVLPRDLAAYVETVRPIVFPGEYPGSPLIAARHLGPSDRLVLFERHKQGHAALVDVFAGDDRARIDLADGYSAALTLAPRRGERVLALVDPSYETEADMSGVWNFTEKASRRWPGGHLLIWIPLFVDHREAELIDALRDRNSSAALITARWPKSRDKATDLNGSAMFMTGATPAVIDRAQAMARWLEAFWRQTAPEAGKA